MMICVRTSPCDLGEQTWTSMKNRVITEEKETREEFVCLPPATKIKASLGALIRSGKLVKIQDLKLLPLRCTQDTTA